MKKCKALLTKRNIRVLYLVLLFVFLFMWAFVQKLSVSPDEGMRYQISLFIYHHGTLPVGYDPEILNVLWGNSYGFNPITPYIIGGIFMKITAVFSTDEFVLLMAARMPSILFGVANAFVVMKLADRLFPDQDCYQWLLVTISSLLPEAVFICSYVNTDSMALFATSLTVYMWVMGIQSRWKYRYCVGLGVALSCCLLSYYNTYGFLLTSLVIFLVTSLRRDGTVPFRTRAGITAKKALIVICVIAALAGWWFVRNYMLYDGDFLGLDACNRCAELYAKEDYKPSNKLSLMQKGITVEEMFKQYHWLRTSLVSFIAAFGYMTIFVAHWLNNLARFILRAGLIGLILILRPSERKELIRQQWNKLILMITMAVSVLLTAGISFYYSYTADFQPQGRYMLPMLTCLAALVTYGYHQWFSLPKWNGRKIEKIVIAGVSCFFAVLALISYFVYFLPVNIG
mgnify:CR=1 FL=1